MKNILKCLLTGLALLLLAACATKGNYAKLIDSWVGATELELVRIWGAPEQTYETDGRKFIVYTINEHSSSKIRQTGDALTPSASIKTIRLHCETTFELSGGIIQSWNKKGNACSVGKKNPYSR